jgi:HEAT repeat protein
VLAKLDGGKLTRGEAAIAKALTDPADQVRASAMLSVAVLAKRRGSAPPALVAALAKTLTSGAWADRRAAALALGRLGAGGDTGALIKAASDTSSFVREAVAIALGDAQGSGSASGAAETLQKLAKDDVPQVREAATRALAGNKR